MILLIVSGTPGEAAAGVARRRISAEREPWDHKGENAFLAEPGEIGKVIGWFCECESPLLWYKEGWISS